MKNLLLAFILVLTAACVTQVEKSDKEGLIQLKLGSSQLKQGLYPQALHNLLAAESIIPKNAVLQNNLGLAYYVRGKNEKAITHIKKAIELNPKYAEARNNLANLFIEKKQYGQAIRQLNIAKENLTFTHPEKILSNLGYVYFYKKKYRTAFKYLKQSLKINRNDCKPYIYYGKSLFELKKFKLASKALLNSVTICPNSFQSEPKYFAALSFIQLGNTQQATALLQEVAYTTEDLVLQNKAKKTLSLLTRVK